MCYFLCRHYTSYYGLRNFMSRMYGLLTFIEEQNNLDVRSNYETDIAERGESAVSDEKKTTKNGDTNFPKRTRSEEDR